MKISTKLCFTITLILTFVIAGISLMIVRNESRLVLQQEKEKNITLIKGLAHVGREAIYRDDDLFLLNYVKLLSKINDAVIYAMVVDSQERIISHSAPACLFQFIKDDDGLRAIRSSGLFFQDIISIQGKGPMQIIDVSMPIIIKDKRAGTARIGFSRNKINEIIKERLEMYNSQIIMFSLIVFLIGLASALIFSFTITQPIKNLVKGAGEIGRGNLDVKIKIRSRDELRHLADEFNSMGDKLKELDRMKRDFTSSVTHELRSPLIAMESYVNEMISDGEEGFKKHGLEDLAVVKNNITRLEHFINDLLDAAKIEAARMNIMPRKAQICMIISEVVQLFNPICNEKKIRLNIDCEAGINEVFIDVNRIRQVITNLLSNAIKFTPEGGSITVSAVSYRQDPASVMVTVKDTGMGIPESELDSIFEKFRQVKENIKNIKGNMGTGLGLYIVKSIVEMHGGKVWVDSKAGEGSEFHFIIGKEK